MKNVLSLLLILVIATKSFSQELDSVWNVDRLSNSTVCLLQPNSDGTADVGTATIIGVLGNLYLLTATHVSKDLKSDAKVVFRLPGDKPLMIDLSSLTGNSSINKWINHPVADMSVIKLAPKSSDMIELLLGRAFPSFQIDVDTTLPAKELEYTFLGFPILSRNPQYFSPLIFSAGLSSGLITTPRADTKTDCTFFYLNVPSMQGCSGSGLFLNVMHAGANYLTIPKTLLIGIIHGTAGDNTGGKIAMVTPMFYLADLIKQGSR